MKVGNEIVIIESLKPYFQKGDKGVVVFYCGENNRWVDFNNHGNEEVYGDGVWTVLGFEEVIKEA